MFRIRILSIRHDHSPQIKNTIISKKNAHGKIIIPDVVKSNVSAWMHLR